MPAYLTIFVCMCRGSGTYTSILNTFNNFPVEEKEKAIKPEKLPLELSVEHWHILIYIHIYLFFYVLLFVCFFVFLSTIPLKSFQLVTILSMLLSCYCILHDVLKK